MSTAAPPPFSLTAPSTADETISSTTHRRIDLQSPADLTHLKHIAALAARSKIDLHLPLSAALRDTNADGRDALRAAVEEAVQKYVEDVFEMAKLGVNVNGVEAERVEWEREVPEEFEPYDTSLATKIQATHARIEALNLALAETRRTAATLAADKFKTEYTALAEAAEAKMDEQTRLAQTSRGAGAEGFLAGVVPFEGREKDVERSWTEALEGLGRLRSGLGETRMSTEKAVEVVKFLEGS